MAADTTNPETIVLHGGYRNDPVTGAVAVPIYQTTSYQFNDAQHAENLFALKELGNIYTRIMNPTADVLEQRLAALEGGVAALALSSGQAASMYAVMNLCRAGDNFVSSTDLYGGTWNLFANTLKDFGVEARFVDPADPEDFAKATDDRTRCYYAETLPNPKLNVFPIKEVADIGRGLGVPLIMDNTACPIICRPFDHGAAVVMYSTTKYLGGHGTSIGGLLVDGGNFDWEAHKERFPHPQRTGPELSRRGLDGGGQAAWADCLHSACAGRPASRRRRRAQSVQLLPDHSRAGDAAPQDARSLRERGQGCRLPGWTRQGRDGDLSEPAGR